MTRIALLRGINVGRRIVKMDRLRGIFSGAGLADVRTFIQSGNVFFSSDETEERLIESLEAALATELGFPVAVCLRTLEEMRQALDKSPFAGREPAPDERFCVSFAARTIPNQVAAPLLTPKGDFEIVAVRPREAYSVWRIVDGKPPVADKFLERTLGVPSTSRFFHTAQKILAAAGE